MIHFITTKLPSLWGGSSIRNYYLIKAAIEAGDEVCVHYIHKDVPKNSDIPDFIKDSFTHYACGKVEDQYFADLCKLRIPYIEALRRNEMIASELILEGDVIQFQELDSYLAVESLVARWQGKFVLDCHNVDYIRVRSELAAGSSWKLLASWPWLWRYRGMEIDALGNVDAVLACSEVDKAYFETYARRNSVWMIPNGVAVNYYEDVRNKKKVTDKALVFVGSLDYPANLDGITHYLESIHPMLLEEMPEVKVVVIGKNPPAWLKDRFTSDTVEIVGFVDDVREYLGEGRIGICPIYEGSGTRLKILEYMASMMPVVSTVKGCEGLSARHGEEILVAQNDLEFKNHLVSLLRDSTLREELCQNGLDFVNEYYDWKHIGKEMLEVYKQL